MPAAAEPEKLAAVVSLNTNYNYQGISQGQDTAFNLSARYRFSEHVVGGVWLGRFELPWYRHATSEVDYFIGYGRRVFVDHRLETALWHYTFVDEAYRHYEWSQWLVAYHIDDRFSFTAALARNFLDADRLTSLIEGTARQTFGRVTTSFSVGRNNLSDTALDSFLYARLQVAYDRRNWTFYGSYVQAAASENYLNRLLQHEGVSLGLSYRLSTD